MIVVDEPTSAGGSRPDVLRIVATSEEMFWDACGWVVVGVEDRGVLLLLLEGFCCGAVMEEVEAVIVWGKCTEGEGLLEDDMVETAVCPLVSRQGEWRVRIREMLA